VKPPRFSLKGKKGGKFGGPRFAKRGKSAEAATDFRKITNRTGKDPARQKKVQGGKVSITDE